MSDQNTPDIFRLLLGAQSIDGSDIMGTADKNTALFVECKWTNEKVDLGVLEGLAEKSQLFHYENKYYYLFAKNGFTKGCVEKAEEMRNVILVRYGDMLIPKN